MSKHRTPAPAEVRAAVVALFRRQPVNKATHIARTWVSNWLTAGNTELAEAIMGQANHEKSRIA